MGNNIVYSYYTATRCSMELLRTQILLEKTQRQFLTLIAEEEERSISDIVREMIDRELRFRQRRQMLLAARELQADYVTDPSLSEFTALDSDDFLFEDEGV
ncbi:MAG: hypothetical protein QY302_01710 [Anaerolineales bacterium]|nr:MAG: hypothetical protein QY302_01710 [Anaerolineales bacterium]